MVNRILSDNYSGEIILQMLKEGNSEGDLKGNSEGD